MTPGTQAGIQKYRDNLHPGVLTAYKGIQASTTRLKLELEQLIERVELVAPTNDHMDWTTAPGVWMCILRESGRDGKGRAASVPEIGRGRWEVLGLVMPEDSWSTIVNLNPYLPGGGLRREAADASDAVDSSMSGAVIPDGQLRFENAAGQQLNFARSQNQTQNRYANGTPETMHNHVGNPSHAPHVHPLFERALNEPHSLGQSAMRPDTAQNANFTTYRQQQNANPITIDEDEVMTQHTWSQDGSGLSM